jgi:hypothetical protein
MSLALEIRTDQKRNLGNFVESLGAWIGSSLQVDEEYTSHHSWGVLSWVGIKSSQLKVVGCFMATNY